MVEISRLRAGQECGDYQSRLGVLLGPKLSLQRSDLVGLKEEPEQLYGGAN
jgi:hypothetical protein